MGSTWIAKQTEQATANDGSQPGFKALGDQFAPGHRAAMTVEAQRLIRMQRWSVSGHDISFVNAHSASVVATSITSYCRSMTAPPIAAAQVALTVVAVRSLAQPLPQAVMRSIS